ncbi:hypothetical protein QYE76_060583 [Lolium multiflorum]|uniref:Retrotransposon gag domain-containing protein n=1 Tax=Lolium multiflorum TaxID=4521 RepID=A0AAD8S0P1_LOLMU|nr:hypothetical protein QYE76_060583 [Lolium multiflorum]
MVGEPCSSTPSDKVFTWEEFKKKFRDAHVPDSVVELKKREFDELRQNTAPIMQYVRDFNRLSRYAPEDVDTEEKRKKQFMKGMNPYMKMQLRLARTAEFQELIDSAITFEDDYRQVQEDRRKRAREPRKRIVRNPESFVMVVGRMDTSSRIVQTKRLGADRALEDEVETTTTTATTTTTTTNYNNNNKRGKPYGKLNCTSLEQAEESDQTVLGTLIRVQHASVGNPKRKV